MLKLKNIISNLFFTFLISLHLTGYGGWGWFNQEATIIGNSGVDAAKIAADAAKEIFEKSGVPMSSQFGLEAAKKLAAAGELLAVVGGVVVCANAVVQTGYLAKDIVTTIYPNGEQKARNQRGEEEYEYLIQRKEFKNCLLKNYSAPRNHSGRPITCEQSAKLLVLVSGDDKELMHLTSMFTKYFN